MVGRASAQGPLCDQLDASLSSSDDSLWLQMQVKSTQAETKLPAPHHPVTNLAYKLNPQEKENKIFESKNRYLHRGQHFPTMCVQLDF